MIRCLSKNSICTFAIEKKLFIYDEDRKDNKCDVSFNSGIRATIFGASGMYISHPRFLRKVSRSSFGKIRLITANAY